MPKTSDAGSDKMNWWHTVLPGQLFVGGLLIGFGLMVLFWTQLFPPLR